VGALTPYVAIEAGDEVFLLKTDGDRLRRDLFARRWSRDMEVLARAVALLGDRAGSTFVDVGANVGTTTVVALRRHGFVRAVSIEPDPANFLMLRLNLVANGVDARVTALQTAIDDRDGERLLALPASKRRSSHLVRQPDEAEAGSAVLTVPAVTLDGLVDRGIIDPSDVGLLWIDAAGSEPAVLEGASKLLAAGTPVVTAVRRSRGRWKETRAVLSRMLGGYTDFVELRDGHSGNDLDALLDSFRKRGKDLLAWRRPVGTSSGSD
jgi:FkbM family methyltransferase